MTIVGSSSLLDTQNAITTALTNSTAFTSICAGPLDLALPDPAYQLNQKLPYVAFGNHAESPWYQFQKTSKQIEFVMHIYSQATSDQEMMTILNVINGVIEAQTLNLTGGNYTNAKNGVIFVSAVKAPASDATTRHLECRWHIWNNAN